MGDDIDGIFDRAVRGCAPNLVTYIADHRGPWTLDEDRLREYLHLVAERATSAKDVAIIRALLDIASYEDITMITWSDAFAWDGRVPWSTPGVKEARHEIAELFHQRSIIEGGPDEKTWPSVILDMVKACQHPGGCDVSAQQSRIAHAAGIWNQYTFEEKGDMFEEAILSPDGDWDIDGYQVAARIIDLAARFGRKDWFFSLVSLEKLASEGKFGVVECFLRHDASPSIAPGPPPRYAPDFRLYSVTTLRIIPYGRHRSIVHWICTMPSAEAYMLLSFLLHDSPDRGYFYVNYMQYTTPDEPEDGEHASVPFITPLSLLAAAGNTPFSNLIMELLVSSGAEIHGAIQSFSHLYGLNYEPWLRELPMASSATIASRSTAYIRAKSPITEAILARRGELASHMLAASPPSANILVYPWGYRYVALASGAGWNPGTGNIDQQSQAVPCPATLAAVMEALSR